MLKIKIARLCAAIAFPMLLIAQVAVADENPVLKRTILLEKRAELPSKNIDAKVIRVSFPPHFKTPEHTHKGPGPRYVSKGKLKVTEQGKESNYSAGDVFWETGLLMTVENITGEPAELIIFEIAPNH